MASLTEIQYLQIEPYQKGTDHNEITMLKMFYLHEFVRWTKGIWWAIENNYLLVYKLSEFAVEWIAAIRMKQKLSSVQKITCITAIADKKIGSILCVSRELYSPPQPSVQFK